MRKTVLKPMILAACMGGVALVSADMNRSRSTGFLQVTYLAMLPAERDLHSQMVRQGHEYQSKANQLLGEAEKLRNGEELKLAGSAFGDGASTIAVLAKGGVEFNPLHPTSPVGIAAFTAGKYLLTSSYVKSLPPEKQDQTRRVVSAGWGGAAIGNLSAIAGALPQVSIPVAIASGLLMYRSSGQKMEQINALTAEAKQFMARSLSVLAAADNFKNQALARAKQRDEVLLAQKKSEEQIETIVQAALGPIATESPATAPIEVATASAVQPRTLNTMAVGTTTIYPRDEDIVALDVPPPTNALPNAKESVYRGQGKTSDTVPVLRNSDSYRRAIDLQRALPESKQDEEGLSPLQQFVIASAT